MPKNNVVIKKRGTIVPRNFAHYSAPNTTHTLSAQSPNCCLLTIGPVSQRCKFVLIGMLLLYFVQRYEYFFE